jgi:hypothetical protein
MIPTHGSQRRIGIEIEVESQVHSYHNVNRILQNFGDNSVWVVDEEGSLRGGYMGWEILTRGSRGQPIGKVQQGMAELYPLLVSSSGIWRAAVHCHVSLDGFSMPAKGLLYALLYALDDSLFEAFAPARRESNFCVPLNNDVSRTLRAIHSYRKGYYPQHFKYTSINSLPVHNEHDAGSPLGTFEFRHMQTPVFHSTVQSVTAGLHDIFLYACMCTSIVDWARMHLDDDDTVSSTLVKWREAYGNEDQPWIFKYDGHTKELALHTDAVLNLLDSFHSTHTIPHNVDKTSLYASADRRPRIRMPDVFPTPDNDAVERMFDELAEAMPDDMPMDDDITEEVTS